jgi:hypothetical protein
MCVCHTLMLCAVHNVCLTHAYNLSHYKIISTTHELQM